MRRTDQFTKQTVNTKFAALSCTEGLLTLESDNELQRQMPRYFGRNLLASRLLGHKKGCLRCRKFSSHPLAIALYVCIVLNLLIGLRPRFRPPSPTLPPAIYPDNWQTVVDGVAYVYAAFLDPRSSSGYSFIRIIGTLRREELRRVLSANDTGYFCQLWFLAGSPLQIYNITARIGKVIYLAVLKEFCNVQFFCNITVSSSLLHDAVVSVTRGRNETNTTFMKLNQNFRRGTEYNFTVCLAQPLFGEVSPAWFVEWVEANIVFGAERILVHNFSISPSLWPYTRYYRRLGLLDVLPWTFPSGLTGETHCHLQQTMITDCQYRLQTWSRYIVIIDLDELIVPRYPDDWTWSELIHRVRCTPDVSSYGFRQLLYRWSSHRGGTGTRLVTSERVYRNKLVYRYPERAKYIADTTKIATAMLTHRVARPKRTKDETCIVPIDVGANHHYKNRTHSVQKTFWMLDDKFTKYGEILMSRTAQVEKAIYTDNY